MKKMIVLLSVLIMVFLFSECGKDVKILDPEAGTKKSADTVSQTVPETAEPTSFDDAAIAETTEVKTRIIVGDPTKPHPPMTEPKAEMPSTDPGTTIKETIADAAESRTEAETGNQIPRVYHPAMNTDTFVITKVSGTYLELRKRIYGSDTEKLVYCCDLGGLDGSADMRYKVGDDIVLLYDYDIAETYPLQLTVREIIK